MNRWVLAATTTAMLAALAGCNSDSDNDDAVVEPPAAVTPGKKCAAARRRRTAAPTPRGARGAVHVCRPKSRERQGSTRMLRPARLLLVGLVLLARTSAAEDEEEPSPPPPVRFAATQATSKPARTLNNLCCRVHLPKNSRRAPDTVFFDSLFPSAGPCSARAVATAVDTAPSSAASRSAATWKQQQQGGSQVTSAVPFSAGAFATAAAHSQPTRGCRCAAAAFRSTCRRRDSAIAHPRASALSASRR